MTIDRLNDHERATVSAIADRLRDDPCYFCGERIGDHTEEMLWRCQRGE